MHERKITVALLFLPLLFTQALAQAQSPATSASPAAQAAQPKRAACLASIATKGVRGPERADEMEICMAEGRLSCIKQAVAEKVPRFDRKKYMQTCMGIQPKEQ